MESIEKCKNCLVFEVEMKLRVPAVHLQMESFEEFCLRSLGRLQSERKGQDCVESSRQQEALSIIRFHGRAILAPLLSVDQRREMTLYRQRAAQLEEDRLRKANLLSRVQDIIQSVQVRKGTVEFDIGGPTSPACSPERPELINGFALLPNMSSPPWGPRDDGVRNAADPPGERRSLTLSDGRGEGGKEEEEEEEEWACHRLSLQDLIKKSRDYLEREQVRRGSWGAGKGRVTSAQPESLSDKENEGTAGEHGRSHSPLTPPPSEADLSPDSLMGCIPPSLTGSFAQLPSPKPSLSPRPHRRRLHPFSAGNILISSPMSAAKLSPKKGQEGGEPGAGTDTPTLNSLSPADSMTPSNIRKGSQSGSRLFCDLTAPVSTSAPSPTTPDGTPLNFRQRSHTLETSGHSARSASCSVQSSEKTPQFVGGLAQKIARHSPPRVLNQSYDVENPSPELKRPHVTTDPAPSIVKHQSELRGSYEGKAMLSPLASSVREQNRTPEDLQRRVSALEEARRLMEQEHAHQLSSLIAEQQREQQRLRQELEERELTLRGSGGDQTLSDSLSTAENSPAHKTGCPSGFSPGVPSSSAHSPADRWGPPGVPCRPRNRVNQVIPPEQQGALCRVTAVARGFLTRRLLKTERLKHLRQTVQDTREFIHSFQAEGHLKRRPVSTQDVSLQKRLTAQLRAALYDIHDVFFVMSLDERLALLQQDRALREERRLREMNKGRSPRERAVLSAATQRSLDRKKQRVTNSPAQGKRVQPKPKSPPINSRVLQPIQGSNAPVPGQAQRRGSLNRKNPEDRVKRADNLRKRNSLC
ncbi:hypothetical protein GJAV_G00265450 [Gymnothorax javanicus]|nr:hypothetical protein GJAV_G00265450 [Gymnothorax javanicus]